MTRESDVDETLKNNTKSPTSETKDVIQNAAAVPPADSQEENKSNENPNSENTTGSPNPATSETKDIIQDIAAVPPTD